MKLATSAYCPEWHPDWDAMERKLDRWFGHAAEEGADLCLLPEYAGIEAALIGNPGRGLSVQDWTTRMEGAEGDYAALIVAMAQRHRLHILGGSLCAVEGGQTVNRAHFATPEGRLEWQDKLIPTPYERSRMGITGGSGLSLFATDLGKIGVLICYDSEFPLLARQLVEAGADMILVPSCTDQPQGQTRVRQSARARAIESQCLVLQAPLVGRVTGCEVVDESTGRAGIFCPPDYGLPADGILAQGDTDVPGWVIAEIDPAAVAAPRFEGQVGNFTHWPEQQRHLCSVRTVDLR